MKNNHTFVVCAYGDSPYLKECLESLKAQTLRSDILLYTSTPSPFIAELCQHYQIPCHTGKGGGIGADWNQALALAQTDFVTIAHQDDIYLPSYGEKIMAAVNEKTTIAFSDYDELKDGQLVTDNPNLGIKRLMLATMALFPRSRFWRKRILAFGNPISCPAVTYHLPRLEGFRFNEEMKVSLDWYAWYQINAYQGTFTYIKESLMYHRIHEASETSQTIQDNKRTEEDLYMFRLFWPKPIAAFLLGFYVKSQDSNG